MNDTDKKLYELLGDKTLSFGCLVETAGCADGCCSEEMEIVGIDVWVDDHMRKPFLRTQKDYNNAGERRYLMEIIGHEPTSTDLFKWMMDNDSAHATLGLWDDCLIFYGEGIGRERVKIPFDLSKKLIDQSEETKLSLINLIESYARD